MTIEEKIKQILSQYEQVKFAYLFGSYAKKSDTPRSDIDIALYFTQDADIFDLKLEIHHALEIKLLKEIDLIVLNSVKNFELLEEILNDGIVLKDSNDDARLMFELYKEHEIKDYKVFQKALNVA